MSGYQRLTDQPPPSYNHQHHSTTSATNTNNNSTSMSDTHGFKLSSASDQYIAVPVPVPMPTAAVQQQQGSATPSAPVVMNNDSVTVDINDTTKDQYYVTLINNAQSHVVKCTPDWTLEQLLS